MADRLAVEGGSPVRDTLLPYGHQVVDEADVDAVAEVLRGDWLTTGPAVEAYEGAFAEYVGARHAVAVTSGTAALHAAAFAAGIGPGDEAITSPLSFAASANCILYCGGQPRFADIQADTCNIDPACVEACITEHTKALIAVDFTGQPADLQEIRQVADRHELVFIEDAAHALGASCAGRRIGQWADLTVFSSHPVKPITTGEGGMIVTDDAELARTMRAFRSHGMTVDAGERARRGDWVYDLAFLGYNYRIPDILCALGTSQLHKLDGWLERRAALARHYDEAFAAVAEVEGPVVRGDRVSAWHLYVLRLRLDQLRVSRQQVFQALRAEGIGVNVHYIPIYWHSHYQNLGYEKGLCPVAEEQYERIITLPLWAGMSDADADDVIAAVTKVIAAYRKE